MESGLMNCPFCGGEGRLEERHNPLSRWKFSVDCTACGSSGPVEASRSDAVTAWNTRAPSDAALVEALEKAEATLALCEHLRSEDRDYGPEVDELGRRIGFGALMSSAQASWRKYLHDKGNPLGSEFVAGPCFGTVTRTLGIIRAALAAAKGQQP